MLNLKETLIKRKGYRLRVKFINYEVKNKLKKSETEKNNNGETAPVVFCPWFFANICLVVFTKTFVDYIKIVVHKIILFSIIIIINYCRAIWGFIKSFLENSIVTRW